MANKVRFGLSNFHYAVWDGDKYGDWISIPGAVSLTGEPQENTSNFYADNIVYYVDITNSGETGSIELAALTDDDLVNLFGYVKDATSGLVYEPTDVVRPTVAIGYEIGGNEEKQRGVRYNVTFNRPSQDAETTSDSSSPNTVTLDYTAIGRDFTVGGKKVNVLKSHCDNSGDTHEAFDNFFSKVPVPGVASA